MLAILVRNLSTSSESLRNKTSFCNYLKPTLAIHPFFLVSESMKTCPEKKIRQASSLSSIPFSLAMADSQRHWVIGQTRKIFFFLPVGISPSRLTLQDILINLHSTRTSYNNEKWFSEALHSVNRSSLIERKAIFPPQVQPVQKPLPALLQVSFFYLFNFFFFFSSPAGFGDHCALRVL